MAFSKEKAHDRAERYAAKGQHDKAAREYLAIVENDPKDVRAWLMLADCLVRCGDREGAIERYLQVAAFYAGEKQPQKALAVYRQVLNLDSSRLDVLLKCAGLNLALGRTTDAIAAYEQVGHAQLQSGHLREAIGTFKLAADADPTVVSKRLRLAELYSRDKRVDEAVEAFREAGDQLLAVDRKADFVRVAERLIYHKNDDKPTIRKLARVYLDLGDPRRALMKLNSLLHADPHDKEGLELLAETFIALQKPDKAVSVLTELVRELRRQGPDAGREALEVLQQGLQWIPGNSELLRLQQELGGLEPSPAAAAEEEPEELELDEADVVELEEEDVVLADSGAELVPEPEPEPGAPMQEQPEPEPGAPMQEQPESLTDTVMSEADRPRATATEVDGQADIDKILFEARVYIKYRLFEHSLDHIREALEQDPEHVGALGLQARALGELGRAQESADAHAAVARQVFDRDPKLAREHIAAALQAVPGHLVAAALQSDLGIDVDGAPAGEPEVSVDDGLDEGLGDSGAFDLVSDEPSGEVTVARAARSVTEEEPEFDISIADSEPELEEPTRQVTIENRFGLSEAGPLPDSEDEARSGDAQGVARSISAAPVSGVRADHTPPTAFEARPPPDSDELVEESLTQPIALAPEATGGDRSRGSAEALSGGPLSPEIDAAEFDDLMLDQEEDEQGDAEQETIPESPADVVIDAAEEIEEEVLEASALEATAAESSGPAPPPGGWPDISDDLAEIRFFLDQGLDEDAEAALAELRSRHGQHPEIAALEVEMGKSTVEPVAEEGAAPLVLLDDEDAEADAYLESIFGGGEDKPKEERSKAGVIADVEEADARTLFDLGTAYREMGLVDDAIAQFDAASRDPQWRSRALVMVGTLRVHRGETEQALADLRRAIESAATSDEQCEASYELGVLYEKIGQIGAAIEHLQAVSEGYRDRDERLQALLG